jgi:hypothetical protein
MKPMMYVTERITYIIRAIRYIIEATTHISEIKATWLISGEF